MMRKISAVLVCLLLGAVFANAQGHKIEIYFSKSNTLTVPEEYTKNINPTVDVGEKVWVWGTITQGDIWNGINMQWSHTVGSGSMYNPSFGTPKKYRWQTSSDFDPVGAPGGGNSVNLVAVDALGLGGDDRDPLQYLDPGGVLWHFLVGEMAFSEPGDVFFEAGGGGITLKGGTTREEVYFGRGDPFIYNNAPKGTRTTLKDLTVIPEPASLLLVGLAGLFLRRR